MIPLLTSQGLTSFQYQEMFANNQGHKSPVNTVLKFIAMLS